MCFQVFPLRPILLHFSRTRYDKCIWFTYRSFPFEWPCSLRIYLRDLTTIKVSILSSSWRLLKWKHRTSLYPSRVLTMEIFTVTDRLMQNCLLIELQSFEKLGQWNLWFQWGFTSFQRNVLRMRGRQWGGGQAIWHTIFLIWKFLAPVFPRVWNLTI